MIIRSKLLVLSSLQDLIEEKKEQIKSLSSKLEKTKSLSSKIALHLQKRIFKLQSELNSLLHVREMMS